MRTDEEIDGAISKVVSTRGANFVALVRLAGMDPARSFRFMDLSGVDFSRQDLRGFDFTGASLKGCKFKNSRIAGTVFDQAEVDHAALRAAADWSERPAAPPIASNSVPIAVEPLANFDDLFRQFTRLAKRQPLRSDTIQGMFRAAPNFKAAAKVYSVCARYGLALTIEHCAELASKMTEASIRSWLLPFLEQFLLAEERYGGSDQTSRLALHFSNVMGKIQDRGYSPPAAFRELLDLTVMVEEALALYEYGASRYGALGVAPFETFDLEEVELAEYAPRPHSPPTFRKIANIVPEGPLYPRPERPEWEFEPDENERFRREWLLDDDE